MQTSIFKVLRVNKGWTQEEASKKIGVTKDTLSSWERGKTSPKLDKIIKMEELYGVKFITDEVEFKI